MIEFNLPQPDYKEIRESLLMTDEIDTEAQQYYDNNFNLLNDGQW